jgi:7-cyano-7-deazaguanine synthase
MPGSTRTEPRRLHLAMAGPPGAVVLLSGGLDSAVTLAIARSEGRRCACLSLDYGQRHRFELEAAARVAAVGGAAEHRLVAVDLRSIGGSALTDDIAVPPARPPERAWRVPITYVPARNLIFLAVAAGFAEVIGAEEIYIGVNAVDYSGYPDCRPEFIRAFEQAAALGTRAGVERQPFRVRTPLIEMSKAEIIRRGAELGVDFAATHSCYDPDERGRACGRCESCDIRRRGFASAGVPDPTVYAPPLETAR